MPRRRIGGIRCGRERWSWAAPWSRSRSGSGACCARKADGTLWCWGKWGAPPGRAVAIPWGGDRVCSLGERDRASCAEDCEPVVGDGVCDPFLDCTRQSLPYCDADCPSPAPVPLASLCHSGRCETAAGENAVSCADENDCGTVCTPNCAGKQCGDNCCRGSCGSCEAGTACDASFQCVPVPLCPNDTCDATETCASCAADCGACSGPAWTALASGVTGGLEAAAFPLNAALGVAVGAGGVLVKRVPDWGAEVLYPTEVASLAPTAPAPGPAAARTRSTASPPIRAGAPRSARPAAPSARGRWRSGAGPWPTGWSSARPTATCA